MSNRSMTRRSVLTAGAGVATAMVADTARAAAAPSDDEYGAVEDGGRVATGMIWHDVADWGVEGRAFDDTASSYDRFPARAEETVSAQLWDLSRDSAGMLTRFRTDSPQVRVRYRLGKELITRSTMAATGSSGVDIYARDANSQERYVSTARPEHPWLKDDLSMDYGVIKDLVPGMHEFTMHFPLRNQVLWMEIGVEAGATFVPIAPRPEKPIVFYGTSIMHGSCASRPGMAIPALVGRRLGVPTVNLGFAAAGRMDEPVIDLLTELGADVYVIDCLPNMHSRLVAERTEPLVHALHEAHPETPILLVEDRTNQRAWLSPEVQDRHDGSRAELRAAYLRLRQAGVENLRYLAGDRLLGDDGEATTDGSHPSDLGMVRYADAYERALRPMIR